MKPLSRRSVTTGMVAAVTAIPALVVARSDPLEGIKHRRHEADGLRSRAYAYERRTRAESTASSATELTGRCEVRPPRSRK